eukprot:5780064-Pleurochrysis_carterae.AAC.4
MMVHSSSYSLWLERRLSPLSFRGLVLGSRAERLTAPLRESFCTPLMPLMPRVARMGLGVARSGIGTSSGH